MEGKNKISLYQEQKKNKPKIEEMIDKVLDGDMKKNAMDFVTYLISTKMMPRWTSTNSWKLSYKNKCVGYIVLKGDGGRWQKNVYWYIYLNCNFFDDKFEKFATNEKLKKIIWGNIRYCNGCLPCAPGKHMILFGKEIPKNICGYRSVEFSNPDTAVLECVKKLIEYKKKEIVENN